MYKIAHISDTHIRNLKYHDDYRQVFKQLYSTLGKEQPDYIVYCGDLAHTKTQLSPEYFDLASDFLDNLGNIAPLIVILGNHDGNLKNESREDAVTPIVNALKNPNITLLKDSGEYSPCSGLTFNVLSVFDRNNWIKPSTPSNINIALYHGSIAGCLTANGWAMDKGDDSVIIFENHDFAMLGDIHKTQSLDSEGRVRYCGSTIQQNFSEDPRKGFLIWEIKSKDDFHVRKVNLANPRPFITITLNSDGTLPPSNVPKNSRLRLISNNSIDVRRLRKACDMARIKWKPYSVTFLNRNQSEALTSQQNYSNTVQENLRDISVQEKHIKEYLADYNLEDEVMEEVLNYNRKYNQKAEETEEVSRNVIWKIKKIRWNNFFNYGEDNQIDFEKLQGLVGIFGRNYSGKSSIIDSVLFTLFNTTSKGERKNVHVINQNKDKANAIIQIQAGADTYQICRNLSKYEKRLKGKVTNEAKVELDFTRISDDESMNGTTRNDTDKNIRKRFGSIDDFFLTSMASQLEPLTFIKEGSTKRKEILAKFLDLEFFDRKFKLAKSDAAEMRGVLKKMQGKKWAEGIQKYEEILEEIAEDVEKQNNNCEILNESLQSLGVELSGIQKSIASIPTEDMDIKNIKQQIKQKLKQIYATESALITNRKNKEEYHLLLDELQSDIGEINIEKLLKDETHWNELLGIKAELVASEKDASIKLKNAEKRIKLLDGIPCGDEFPKCKFICDANKAKLSIGDLQSEKEYLKKQIFNIEDLMRKIDNTWNTKQIRKYNTIVKDIEKYKTAMQNIESKISMNESDLKLFETEVRILEEKEKLYEENKDAIENLSSLRREEKGILSQMEKKQKLLKKCNKKLTDLYIEQGASKQTLKSLLEGKEEMEKIEREWIAYDLFMQCMHPNGIPYNVIKNKLPLLNEEISKILANIVDFEVFFENNDKKLDINIKHPYYDPRPLSMGSGAEKTLASMAIRLALISITNLPKSELFILDEPATALDSEHMEGFIRLLQMIKNQFKTVILISHLDSLKDVVDMTIDIEKVAGFAKVRI